MTVICVLCKAKVKIVVLTSFLDSCEETHFGLMGNTVVYTNLSYPSPF